MRFYLGTGKYTPNAAVIGDMGWEPTTVRQLATVSTFWARCVNMGEDRVNKLVFNYCLEKAGPSCKNWAFRDREILHNYNLGIYTDSERSISKSALVKAIKDSSLERYKTQWIDSVNNDRSRNGQSGNKLRSYRLFKQSFSTEKYVTLILPRKHRAAFCKFRAGVAPLRIETGRYERLPVDQRLCPFCKDLIENEIHVILKCPMYADIRSEMFQIASANDSSFYNKTECDKFVYLFSADKVDTYCCQILL